MRWQDEFILRVLDLRRMDMPSAVARKLGITPDRVRSICRDIKEADVKHSKSENLDDILLHYPHT